MRIVIGNNLKKLREIAGYKQQEVSDYIGIERGAYANYESGSREMPYDLLLNVCELYGTDLASILDEVFQEDLACAFRIDTQNTEDIKEIAQFKQIVRNYLKMCSLSE